MLEQRVTSEDKPTPSAQTLAHAAPAVSAVLGALTVGSWLLVVSMVMAALRHSVAAGRMNRMVNRHSDHAPFAMPSREHSILLTGTELLGKDVNQAAFRMRPNATRAYKGYL